MSGETEQLKATTTGSFSETSQPQALGLTCWITSPLTQVFRETPPQREESGIQAGSRISLVAARGEIVATQMVLRGEGRSFDAVGVEPGMLGYKGASPGDSTLFATTGEDAGDGITEIDSSAWEVSWVEYFRVEKNSKATPPQELIRTAPADFPDALNPASVGKVPSGANQPVFLQLNVPRNARPGIYEGSVRVRAIVENGLVEFEIPVELEVLPLELPEKTRLFVTLWVSYGDLAGQHNVEMWSEDFWKVLSVYARDMARHHQNVILTPLSTVEVKALPDGSFRFDFSRLGRWIEVFTDAGLLTPPGRLEFGHVAGRVSGKWEDQFALGTIWAEKLDSAGEPTGQKVEVPISEFVKALQDYLESHNLLDRAMLHIADEPIPVNEDSWREISRKVHQAAPKLRRIDAVHVTDLEGDLEVWVPQLNFFSDAYPKLHELQCGGGMELWFYTAWVPQGSFPNRLMDYPVIKTRLLHWVNFLYGATGYLHWGYNFWGVPFDQFSPGDNWIVWPGPDGPRSSLRYEAMRQGIEDYEFLMMLVDHTREVVKKLATQAGLDYKEAAEVAFGGGGKAIDNIWDPRLRAVELARLVMRGITDYTWDDSRLLAVRTTVEREIIEMQRHPWALVKTSPTTDEPLEVGALGREVRVEGFVEAGTTVELEVPPDEEGAGGACRKTVEVDSRGYFSAGIVVGAKREVLIHLRKGEAQKTLVRRWLGSEVWKKERALRRQMQARAAGKEGASAGEDEITEAAGALGGTDVVLNGGFEEGRTGWSGGTVVRDEVHSGKASLLLEAIGPNPGGVWSVQRLPVKPEPGATYYVEAYAKGNYSTRTGRTAGIALEWWDGQGKWQGGIGAALSPGEHPEWTRLSAQGTIPQNSDLAELRMVLYLHPDTEGRIYFDDVRVIKVVTP